MFNTIQTQINAFLWPKNLDNKNLVSIFFIKLLRIFYATGRDLSEGLPSLRAMSLVYTTLLSIVPLLAVSFSLMKGFGAHNQLEPALLGALEPLGEQGIELGQQIVSFVDNMQLGVLGSIGLVFLIFTVLSLVKKIESAFNATWRIQGTRNFFQRFSNYLSVILVGPLLLFTGAGLTASFNSSKFTEQLLAIEPFGTILLFIGELVPYLLSIITFTLIYVLIPNTKVKLKSAFFGAVITTIVSKATGALFTTFIVNSTNYTAIYSGFAILVIFMIWIYINWLLVLTGASITYYHQNPDCIPDQSQVTRLSCRLREKLALTIMQLIATNFHNNNPPWSVNSLAKQTNMSQKAVNLVITTLEKNNLITEVLFEEKSAKESKSTKCSDNNRKFLLTQAAENISIKRILNAARIAEETSHLHPDDVHTTKNVNDIITLINTAITESSQKQTLKDLIEKV